MKTKRDTRLGCEWSRRWRIAPACSSSTNWPGSASGCVCELTEMIGDDISTVSKHLALLKKAGIICDDKRGNQVFYRLCVPCILDFFRCIETVIECNGSGRQACACKG